MGMEVTHPSNLLSSFRSTFCNENQKILSVSSNRFALVDCVNYAVCFFRYGRQTVVILRFSDLKNFSGGNSMSTMLGISNRFLLVFFSLVITFVVLGCTGDDWVPSDGSSIIYISKSGDDSNIGMSATSPLRTLPAAIELAKSDGFNKIYVTAETYTRGDGISENADGVIIENFTNLEITGGWDGNFNSRSGMSVLDGGGASSYRIVRVTDSENIKIDGFVIKGGRLTGDQDSEVRELVGENGPGICCYLVNNSTISNCIVSDNSTANGLGGGIYVCGNSNTIGGSIHDNTANGGGGVYIDHGISNTVSAEVYNNQVTDDGGGIVIGWGYGNTISGDVHDNTAGYHAGGIGIGNSVNREGDSTTKTTITGRVYSNTAPNSTDPNEGYGAGIFIGSSNNVTVSAEVYDNISYNTSGGIHIKSSQDIQIVNATIKNNSSTTGSCCSILLQSIRNDAYNWYPITGLSISNCVLGGAGAGTCAIYEYAGMALDVSGHTIENNIFLTDTLAYLYHDRDDDSIANTGIAILNTADHTKHGASTSSGNQTLLESEL